MQMNHKPRLRRTAGVPLDEREDLKALKDKLGNNFSSANYWDDHVDPYRVDNITVAYRGVEFHCDHMDVLLPVRYSNEPQDDVPEACVWFCFQLDSPEYGCVGVNPSYSNNCFHSDYITPTQMLDMINNGVVDITSLRVEPAAKLNQAVEFVNTVQAMTNDGWEVRQNGNAYVHDFAFTLTVNDEAVPITRLWADVLPDYDGFSVLAEVSGEQKDCVTFTLPVEQMHALVDTGTLPNNAWAFDAFMTVLDADNNYDRVRAALAKEIEYWNTTEEDEYMSGVYVNVYFDDEDEYVEMTWTVTINLHADGTGDVTYAYVNPDDIVKTDVPASDLLLLITQNIIADEDVLSDMASVIRQDKRTYDKFFPNE